ncbi:CDP-alcohol phosphatidyltransferase family protein [Lipingzhangella sp. LS1_29]|uniref:CDP-alcohol phosphatidyltransferase family protein n=1 Tax=Lipingzhangella rawalii TaxID=2055835 RepID=A0ABU2HA74_9ACTN|nr:CDP-alcohol phosphatidyltransferase family protein [Lipingzhangella rawalii]MDS1272188.1 CDP-alcohol phosphatidyltransferase family protein [Lipingzhangella rawalii]
MAKHTLAEVRERTYKSRDSWWTVFLVDPLAGRLVVWAANHTALTPNQVTFGAAVLGAGSAACLVLGSWPWLFAGALLFHLSFVLDCVDGKLARLTGTGTVFGVWVDFILDRVRFFACMSALLAGQWLATGDVLYLLLAPPVVFLDLMRYLNAAQVDTTRRVLHRRCRSPGESPARPQHPNDALGAATQTGADAIPEPSRDGPSAPPTDGGGTGADGSVPGPESSPLPTEDRLRAALARHRVRPHLFSGIEFEMTVCVLAPASALLWLFGLPNTIAVIVAAACACLLLFEFVVVYRLWAHIRARSAEPRESRP